LKILSRITEPTEGREKIRRKFDEIVTFAEVERFLDSYG
jgi:hypothetical protein